MLSSTFCPFPASFFCTSAIDHLGSYRPCQHKFFRWEPALRRSRTSVKRHTLIRATLRHVIYQITFLFFLFLFSLAKDPRSVTLQLLMARLLSQSVSRAHSQRQLSHGGKLSHVRSQQKQDFSSTAKACRCKSHSSFAASSFPAIHIHLIPALPLFLLEFRNLHTSTRQHNASQLQEYSASQTTNNAPLS